MAQIRAIHDENSMRLTVGCDVQKPMIPHVTHFYRISELFEIIVDYEDKTHPLPVLQDLKVRIQTFSSDINLTHVIGVPCEDWPAKRVGEWFT